MKSKATMLAIALALSITPVQAATFQLPAFGTAAIQGPIPAEGFFATVSVGAIPPPFPLYFIVNYSATVANFAASTHGAGFITNIPATPCPFCDPFEPLFVPGGYGDVQIVFGASFSGSGGGSLYGSATPFLSISVPEYLTVTVTPIPAALPLFATGLGALGLVTYRRRKRVARFF